MPVSTGPEKHRRCPAVQQGGARGIRLLAKRQTEINTAKEGAIWEASMLVQATQSMPTVTSDSVMKATQCTLLLDRAPHRTRAGAVEAAAGPCNSCKPWKAHLQLNAALPVRHIHAPHISQNLAVLGCSLGTGLHLLIKLRKQQVVTNAGRSWQVTSRCSRSGGHPRSNSCQQQPMDMPLCLCTTPAECWHCVCNSADWSALAMCTSVMLQSAQDPPHNSGLQVCKCWGCRKMLAWTPCAEPLPLPHLKMSLHEASAVPLPVRT